MVIKITEATAEALSDSLNIITDMTQRENNTPQKEINLLIYGI